MTQAAAGPVMRVLAPAWRFNGEIPTGARLISVVAMDAGDGSREDYAPIASAIGRQFGSHPPDARALHVPGKQS